MLHSETLSESYPGSFIDYCDWEKNLVMMPHLRGGGEEEYVKVLLVFALLKGIVCWLWSKHSTCITFFILALENDYKLKYANFFFS